MRILVLCTHNSARSQLAEGWLRHHAAQAGLEAEVRSAGTEATQVKPEAVQVMQEVGIDLSGHASKALMDLPDPWDFDVVLTVCDQANEACPVYPAATTRLHLAFPDPSGHDLPRWREVRDALGVASRKLIDALAAGRTPTAAEIRPLDPLRDALARQYRAALAMHRSAVERCPDALWTDQAPTNAFWQVAYHALFFTHLYLMPEEADFRPWPQHQGGVQHEDGIAGPADPNDSAPLLPEPYSKEQVLAYADYLQERIDAMVEELDLTSPQSGFWWYRIPKVEHQLVNLRHLQHHAAQLVDRVRAATGEGTDWVSSG